MKKIYTLILSVVATTTIYAQVDTHGTTLKKAKNSIITTESNSQQKGGPSLPTIASLGDTIYYEGFANGLPASWTNSGSPAAAIWEYRGPSTTPSSATGGQGACSTGNPIESATATDGFMIFDSNYLDDNGSVCGGNIGSGAAPADHTGALQTGAIDCSNFSSVILGMHHFGREFNCTWKIYVSTDGTTFTEIADVTSPSGNNDPDSYLNVNISTIAGGQSTVYIKMEFDGQYYEWMIDDLLLTEGSGYDIGISDTSFAYLHDWLLPYYSMIPKTHSDTIYHAARAVNMDANDATETVLTVDVNDGSTTVFSSSSIATDILSGEDSILTVQSYFVPQYGNTYSANYQITFDSTDGSMNNNEFTSESYEITDSVYARDFETASQNLTSSFYSLSGGYAFGNIYDFVNNDKVKSISVFISGASVAGSPLIGILYGNDRATVVAATDIHILTSSDLNSWLTLPIVEAGGMLGGGTPATEVDVNALDFYYAIIDNLGADNSDIVVGGHNNKGGFNGNYGYLDGTWYWLNQVPMVRLNTVGDPCNYYQLNEFISDANCNGVLDGSISLSPTGGTNYTYNWSTGSSNSSISNLSAGTYDVTITDATCNIIKTFIVNQPNALSTSVSMNSASCDLNNGDATVIASGGTAPYSFMWDNAETTSSTSGTIAGSYNVTVTDDNGCTATDISVVSSLSSSITLSTSVTDDACGYDMGEIAASATSSSGSITYMWDNGETTASITGLTAGTYSLTTTDAGDCVTSEMVTVSEIAPAVMTGITTTDASCGSSNGSASVDMSTTYTYVWDDDANQTTATATGLDANAYFVIITNTATTCVGGFVAIVNNPAADISVTSTPADVDCFGSSTGSIDIVGTSSTTIVGYSLWTIAGDSITTVASSGNTTLTGLPADVYFVIGGDAAGCIASNQVTVNEPTLLTALATASSEVTCNAGSDGTATVTADGGTMGTGYSYMWNNGETTASPTNLMVGNNDVTVTDANGCTAMAQVSTTEPVAIVVSITSIIDTVCFGAIDGSATSTMSGGVSPFVYAWSNGDNSVTNTTLGSGSHDLTVTDNNGCIGNSNMITISEHNEILITVTQIISTVCFSEATGSASAMVTGGASPYSYSWPNGNNTNAANDLNGGSHSITVTDNNGCSETSNSITVMENGEIVPNVTVTDESCFGCADGSVSTAATGGTPSFSYMWSNGATTTSLTGLTCPSSTFDCTVTDSQGCTASESAVFNCDLVNTIEEVENNSSLNIYPNPNNGVFNVELNAVETAEYTFIVRNVIGQTVSSSTETINGNFIKTIDLSNQTDGMYFLTVKSNNSEKTAKIIVK